MTYYQFRTTLLPSLPRKRMTTPNAVPMRKSKTLQSVLFFFSPLPFLKNWKKSLFFSTSTRLPNTYFLLCITKTSSIVYNHNTISLRKKKKQQLSSICRSVCRVVRWQLSDLERCHQKGNTELPVRHFKGPGKHLLVICPRAEIGQLQVLTTTTVTSLPSHPHKSLRCVSEKADCKL